MNEADNEAVDRETTTNQVLSDDEIRETVQKEIVRLESDSDLFLNDSDDPEVDVETFRDAAALLDQHIKEFWTGIFRNWTDSMRSTYGAVDVENQLFFIVFGDRGPWEGVVEDEFDVELSRAERRALYSAGNKSADKCMSRYHKRTFEDGVSYVLNLDESPAELREIVDTVEEESGMSVSRDNLTTSGSFPVDD